MARPCTFLPANAWLDTGGYRSQFGQSGRPGYAASCLESRAGCGLVALRSCGDAEAWEPGGGLTVVLDGDPERLFLGSSSLR